jgi:hypothetical protein
MPGADAAVARGTETTSPELVLVDSVLAPRARERLPEPGDTLARVESDLTRRRLARLAENAGATEDATRKPMRPRMHRAFGARWPSKLVAVGAIAAALATALLIGVNVDLRGIPAGADSTVQDRAVTEDSTEQIESQPPSSGPNQLTTSPPSRPPPAAGSRASGPRRFAWAPVSGASGYRVEFFREDARIYSAVRAEPQFKLPSSWSFEGRRQRLSPGTYRWYVWPVLAGLRQSEATVQAELVVP